MVGNLSHQVRTTFLLATRFPLGSALIAACAGSAALLLEGSYGICHDLYGSIRSARWIFISQLIKNAD